MWCRQQGKETCSLDLLMLPQSLFKRHLKLSLLLFPATFMRRFPPSWTHSSPCKQGPCCWPPPVQCVITHQMCCSMCFCINLKLVTQINCWYTSTAQAKNSQGYQTRLFYVFQSVHSSCVTKNFQLQVSETLLKIGHLVYHAYMYVHIKTYIGVCIYMHIHIYGMSVNTLYIYTYTIWT